MVTFRLTSIAIFIGVYITINIKQTRAFPLSSTSSPSELNSICQNISDVDPSGLNIRFTVEATITSSNLRNVIVNGPVRNDSFADTSKGVKSSTTESTEEEGLITPSSTKDEHLGDKLQIIEKKLKELSASIEKKSIGVHCNTCNQTERDEAEYPRNCKEIQRNGNNITGIYEIRPKNAEAPFPVLCDMEIRGGGWIVIQKRFDGSQDFFLGWRDYKFGFGNLEGEFWLGLQKLYVLSGFETVELLVEVVSKTNVYGYAHYSSFSIGSEPGGYKLDRLSGFSGDIGDSLTYHQGSKFSTKDLDFTDKGCATSYPGGWWYKGCLWSNLNGKHINIDLPEKYAHQGIQWYTFVKDANSHSKSRMLIRSVN